jgi:hypothetical protein
MINPIKVISLATKKVPVVRFALGLVGIAAALAIGLEYFSDLKVAIWGTIIILFLMMILILIGRISQSDSKVIRDPMITLLWCAVIIFILILLLLTTSVFFKYPSNLSNWLNSTETSKAVLKKDQSLSDSASHKTDSQSNKESTAQKTERSQKSRKETTSKNVQQTTYGANSPAVNTHGNVTLEYNLNDTSHKNKDSAKSNSHQ